LEYKLIETGIEPLDEMLGGGILEDSSLLLIYDTNSYGWALAVEIFRNLVKLGWFGVITNYSLPYSLLVKYGRAVGFDVEKAGREGKLAVIDVFSSVNKVKQVEPFVYTLDSIDISTFLPKVVSLYMKVSESKEKRIGLTVTLDGFTAIFGENRAIKILQRNIALKDEARLIRRDRPVNVLLLNRDRVSMRFLSWISQYSEHIIEFIHTEFPGVERMLIKKSLIQGFEPKMAEFSFSKGKIKITPV
jgi:archaellum biogenesis ATPase FlaH